MNSRTITLDLRHHHFTPMKEIPTWFLIENETEYKLATERNEQVKRAPKGSLEHREKLLLAHLISQYEKEVFALPEVDPIEMIKIRMKDMNLKAADLARLSGDKSNISKVLKYQQGLSIEMIRLFSEALRIPAELLIKDYPLKTEAK